MSNRKNRNYNDRHYEYGDYDIFVREHRRSYDRHDYHNNDKGTSGAPWIEIIGAIVGIALLLVSF